MKLLFVTARFPYPALKGDQVRAYHQLRLLAEKHSITLLSFGGEDVRAEDRAHVESLCDAVIVVPLSRPAMAGALLRNVRSGLPLQTALYQTAAMRAHVRAQLRNGFDLVHVQLARMAEHVMEAGTPCYVDLIDALSLNMDRRAAEQHGPLKAVFVHEARRMHEYERRICESFAVVSVVAPADRDAIGPFANLTVNGNGVDVEHFAFARGKRRKNALIFSGNMGYFPNVNAVSWFVRDVLPLIQAEIPSVTFEIAGTNPARDVRALAERNDAVSVTGFVADVRAHLTRATVGVVPMRAGTGMQNKVVEAMACGTPLVATPFALGGIDAVHERHLLVAGNARVFAAQTVRLLRNAELRDELACAARELVVGNYSWNASVGALERLYERARGIAPLEYVLA
jgi:sugar transferase (PEP-CTERM/EpsH1 system associated)